MASTTTYLQLVNNTILEAGCDLAFFASDGSDFGTSTNILHTRFKKWVKDAWRDIQQSAPDWHFLSDRSTTRIRPRISWNVSSSVGVTTTLPTSEDYIIRPLVEATTLHTVHVIDCKIRQGVLNSSVTENCEGYVVLRGNEADQIDFGLDIGSTALAFTDVGIAIQLTISGWGSYAFNESTQNSSFPPVRDTARRINPTTFRIAQYGTSVAQGADDVVEGTLPFVSWETFQQQELDLGSNQPGMPRYVTQDYEGRYRFFPAPDKDYLVVFDYEKGVQFLDEWDDIPFGIPEEFVELILWKALQYYGQFEELPSLSNTQNTGRADKQAKIMQMRMERQTRELVHFKPLRLY